MSFFQSILLGVMQGISEFLPISSSGHLVVMRAVMRIENIPVLYDVILHIATLLVVMVYFRKRIFRILAALLRWVSRSTIDGDDHHVRLAGIILAATVMTGGIGLAISGMELHAAPKLVSSMFLLTAVLLIAAHFVRNSRQDVPIQLHQGIIVGIVQGLAAIPGISRSGSTIAASLYSGVSREHAAEFSFLISIPAVFGALLLELRDISGLSLVVSPAAMVGGFLASLIVGYFSIILLVKLLHDGRLWVFSIYLIPLGVWGLFAL
ncbi:MAG: undecaprenyl-diphosphate phosphatase [Spirochaeta sp.]